MADYPALDIRFRSGVDASLRDDLLYAALDDHAPLAIQDRPESDGWVVYFRQEAARDAAAEAVSPLLGQYVDAIATLDVPDEDWARRSQASLRAVTVGALVVAPPWDLPSDTSRTIVVDPSMGFGTGHHQTTRLCLRLLQRLPLDSRSLLDVGTGSGVLAIAAAMLGATPVVAMDIDPDALQNARENIDRNALAGRIAVVEADLANLTVEPADVVVANLTGAVLKHHAAALLRLVRPAGAMIVSGFSPSELPDVLAALQPMTDVETLEEDDWAAAMFGARSS